jgi:hypothetical protein
VSGICTGTPYTCTPGTCEAASTCDGVGGCTPTYATTTVACDDGNICSSGDHCDGAGHCGGTPYTCAPTQCQVSSACQGDGSCLVANKPNGTTCNDGDACTQVDTCQEGVCVGYAPVTCPAPGACQLPGTCNPASGACVYPARPDGSSCTGGSCLAGACLSSADYEKAKAGDGRTVNGWSCASAGGGTWVALVLAAAALRRTRRARRAGLPVALALALGLGLAPAAHAADGKPTPTRTAVLDLTISGKGVDGAALTDAFAAGLQDPLFKLVSMRDVTALLGFERAKQLVGCAGGESCLAEIAGALGTELVAAGSVGRVGNRLLVTGSILEARRSTVLARATATVDDEAELPEAIADVARQLRAGYRANKGIAEDPALAAGRSWSPGLYAGAAYDPAHAVFGGELALTIYRGPWSYVAGGTFAEHAAGRVAVLRRVVGSNVSRFELALGPRFLLAPSFPGGTVMGGGVAATSRLRLGRSFDLVGTVAGEGYKTPNGNLFAPLLGVGFDAHL